MYIEQKLWLLLGPPMLIELSPSQQHAGLHHAVDGGANQEPAYLCQSLQLYSPW